MVRMPHSTKLTAGTQSCAPVASDTRLSAAEVEQACRIAAQVLCTWYV